MNTTMAWISLLGTFTLFMYGSRMITTSIHNVTNKNIASFFDMLGSHRGLSGVSGFFVTMLVQSSSDVIMILTSLTNSGLLYVKQALWVIMGANIGSTMTNLLYAIFVFNPEFASYAMLFILVGYFCLLGSIWKKLPILGELCFGLGLVLFGITCSLDLIHQFNYFSFLSQMNPESVACRFTFLLAGCVLTLVFRSSVFNTILAMVLTVTHMLSLDLGLFITLGGNVGSAIRASLVGLSMHRNSAKSVALWHLLFNMVGVLLWFMLFDAIMTPVLRWTIVEKMGPPLCIALFDTVVNVSTALLFCPLEPLYSFVWRFFSKDPKPSKGRSHYRLNYHQQVLADVPELLLSMAKKEIVQMTGLVEEMADDYINVFNHPDEKMKKVIYALDAKEELSDEMYVEITRFLVECSKNSLLNQHHENISFLSRIVKELESAADCISHLTKLCQRRYEERIHYRQEVQVELNNYFNLALDFFKSVKNKLMYKIIPGDLDQINYAEHCINQECGRLRENAQHALEGSSVNVKAEIMFMDHVRHIEQLGDCCMNIAEALQRLK